MYLRLDHRNLKQLICNLELSDVKTVCNALQTNHIMCNGSSLQVEDSFM